MTASFTLRFRRRYQKLSPERQAKFDKQLAFLLSSLRDPSLRSKKYDEPNDIWQARMDGDDRFYFRIEGDTYLLLSIVPPSEMKANGDRHRRGLSRTGTVPLSEQHGDRHRRRRRSQSPLAFPAPLAPLARLSP
jgi:mRNA-degrading endonuclease RelE of RelBE toxin-antitoxin system